MIANWESASGRTWIGPEEMAYNTPNGTHWKSNRRARVVCSDGHIRIAVIGIPDTYSSIPGHIKMYGMVRTGYVARIGNYHVDHLGYQSTDLEEWGFFNE